jgi:hypothetical protein
MTERNEPRDAERLPAETARRLLARASELEAARGSELSIAELREAAREAGIAPAAFDQALTELRERDSALHTGSPPSPSGLRRIARFWPAALIVAAFLSLLVLRLIVPAT